MKTYKDYPKISLGYSDMSELIVRTPADLAFLYFGKDGSYSAYVVDEECEIPEHYTLRGKTNAHWLKVYDDEGLTATFYGTEISIYRAGEMGCIVKVVK